MLRLYILPGKLIAELLYLFPSSGQLWASQRRRSSRIAHLFYATALYALAAVVIVKMVAQDRSKVVPPQARSEQAMTKPATLTVAPMADRDRISVDAINQTVQAQQTLVGEVTDTPAMRMNKAEDVEPVITARVETLRLTPGEEELIRAPREVPAIEAAAREAFETGLAQRWTYGRLEGVAAPSLTNTGCTLVRVEVDGIDESLQPSNPIAMCP